MSGLLQCIAKLCELMSARKLMNSQLQLFLDRKTLEYIILYLYGDLLETKNRNRRFLIIIERKTKIKRTILMTHIEAVDVEKHFCAPEFTTIAYQNRSFPNTGSIETS